MRLKVRNSFVSFGSRGRIWTRGLLGLARCRSCSPGTDSKGLAIIWVQGFCGVSTPQSPRMRKLAAQALPVVRCELSKTIANITQVRRLIL